MDITDVRPRRCPRRRKMSKDWKYSKLLYRNKAIASKIVYCDSFIMKGTGLMFRPRNAIINTAWLFRFRKPRKVSVTMMFVFFPIDLVFLDDRNTILELKSDLAPFSGYDSREKTSAFVELERGTIKKYRLKKGRRLFFRR